MDPSEVIERDVAGRKQMLRNLYQGSNVYCYDSLRLTKRSFSDLCTILRERCDMCEKIMENALNSVKGTSFGLGEAASTAASAVAAGVEPGKELERYLKLSGDAAAVAGVDINEMGAIFNKVQTSNKIQMGEMNQLLDRGIQIGRAHV